LIPDYIDCKYFAGKPVATNNFGFVSLQRKSFTDTFRTLGTDFCPLKAKIAVFSLGIHLNRGTQSILKLWYHF